LSTDLILGNAVGNVEQELDIMQLDYVTRVNRGHAKLEDYYNHIIGLLSEKSAHVQIIKVARLALSDLLGVSMLVVFFMISFTPFFMYGIVSSLTDMSFLTPIAPRRIPRSQLRRHKQGPS